MPSTGVTVIVEVALKTTVWLKSESAGFVQLKTACWEEVTTEMLVTSAGDWLSIVITLEVVFEPAAVKLKESTHALTVEVTTYVPPGGAGMFECESGEMRVANVVAEELTFIPLTVITVVEADGFVLEP